MRSDTRIPIDYRPVVSRRQEARRRKRRWLLSAVVTALLGSVATYLLTDDGARIVALSAADPSAPLSSAAPALAIAAPIVAIPPVGDPLGETVDFIVRRNDTLESIFRRFKLNLDDLSSMLGLPRAHAALNRIRPGEKLTVIHEDGLIRTLERRLSDTEILAVKRADEGFVAEVFTTPIEVRIARAHGTIDTSLFVAARAAGVSPETILRLANDVFGWDIDFALDIRPGDRFNMVYEQKYRNGEYIGDGRIVAAEFINDGEIYRAVHYASDDGAIDDYFTPEGRSVRRQFLRAPLDFTRVSSNFNLRRRHPILNITRAHQGVDYSAPTGTIIKAAGDGRVAFVGRKGGYGKVVILEHGGGISTLYGHMHGFARGMRPGLRVRQGQTIGYVGRTGAATGPHLHYEYRVNGRHKNPRTVRLPDAAPIPARYLADFESKTGILVADLEQAHDAAIAAAPAE